MRPLHFSIAVAISCIIFPIFNVQAAAANEVATQRPVEIHDQLVGRPHDSVSKRVALTLDACGGAYDADIINFLVAKKIPATIFATKKWLDKNPVAINVIKAHLDLFDVEDHGAEHVPAVIGANKRVYGILGNPDIEHLRNEVTGGADAVYQAIGVHPHWYRAATAEYDKQSIEEIQKMGFSIAGFSINSDSGATLNRSAILARLKNVQDGDIIIGHMNKPKSDSAEGLIAGITKMIEEGVSFVRLDQSSVQRIP